MNAVSIILTSRALDAIRHHLFGNDADCEEAAFLFADVQPDPQAVQLQCREWLAIPPMGFARRSPWFLELTDALRGQLIKKAHDLQCSLIEVHSHPSQDEACFSWSDLRGFDEFVPHVLWRLPSRPYGALVMTDSTFDGLLWYEPQAPVPVAAIQLEDTHISATGLTVEHWNEISERSPI